MSVDQYELNYKCTNKSFKNVEASFKAFSSKYFGHTCPPVKWDQMNSALPSSVGLQYNYLLPGISLLTVN